MSTNNYYLIFVYLSLSTIIHCSQSPFYFTNKTNTTNNRVLRKADADTEDFYEDLLKREGKRVVRSTFRQFKRQRFLTLPSFQRTSFLASAIRITHSYLFIQNKE